MNEREGDVLGTCHICKGRGEVAYCATCGHYFL